jgi:hypothetical protein
VPIDRQEPNVCIAAAIPVPVAEAGNTGSREPQSRSTTNAGAPQVSVPPSAPDSIEGRKTLNLSGRRPVPSGVDRGHRSPRQALVGKALVYAGAEALSATVRAWLGAAGRTIATGHPA